MSIPANVTDSDAGFSRLPPHPGQSVASMYCITRRRIAALCVWAKVCSTCRRALLKVPM